MNSFPLEMGAGMQVILGNLLIKSLRSGSLLGAKWADFSIKASVSPEGADMDVKQPAKSVLILSTSLFKPI